MEQEKQFIRFADGADKEQAVVTIGGREYAVVPMCFPAAVPAEAVDFADKNYCDGLSLQMRQPIRSFMDDILMHLEHCAAFTVTEEEEPDPNIRRLTMFLPLLLPLDERERWCMKMTDEQIKQMTGDGAQRIRTGRPRAFKVVSKSDPQPPTREQLEQERKEREEHLKSLRDAMSAEYAKSYVRGILTEQIAEEEQRLKEIEAELEKIGKD